MKQTNSYVDMKGREYSLSSLDTDERALFNDLQAFAKEHADWGEFNNFYVRKVGDFYKSRGLSREETVQTVVWRIAQDIGGRMHIAQGQARPSDYRDELEYLIRTKFRTRRQFLRGDRAFGRHAQPRVCPQKRLFNRHACRRAW